MGKREAHKNMVHLEGGRTKARDREGGGKGHPGLVSCDAASVPMGAGSGPDVWSEYPGHCSRRLGRSTGRRTRPLLFSRPEAKVAQAGAGQ